MRQRIDVAHMVCSSENYRASKKAHVQYLKRTEVERQEVIKTIPVKAHKPKRSLFKDDATVKRAYILFRFKGQSYPGKKIYLAKDEVEAAAAAGFAVHYE